MNTYSFEFTTSSANREMSNGMRMYGNAPLTDEEILIVKQAIAEIEADDRFFVFNDKDHLSHTCYNSRDDVIYIGRNIFPDTKYGSTHPRDMMSIRAVLAHEYYGHRTYRDEYLDDLFSCRTTTPEWQDECRASITAAKIAPGLTQMDRYHLVQDAVKRAEEYGQWIKTDDFMKEVLYGYPRTSEEHGISTRIPIIEYVSAESQEGNAGKWSGQNQMPKVPESSNCSSRGFVR